MLAVARRELMHGNATADPVIAVSSLARGAYLLHLTTASGRVMLGRFVRE